MKIRISYLLLLLFLCFQFTMVKADDKVQFLPVTAVNNFQLKKYLGKWYEVARLPNAFEKKCNFPITATYQLLEDGKIEVINTCIKEDGSVKTSTGVAVFVKSATLGQLKVTFAPSFLSWLSFAYGDYWVLNTDYKTYALVGDPNRQYLWILSRDSNLNANLMSQLIAEAKSVGYDVSDLIIATNN